MTDAEIYDDWYRKALSAAGSVAAERVESYIRLTPWRSRLIHSQGLRKLSLYLWRYQDSCANGHRSNILLATFILIGGLACTGENGEIRKQEGQASGPPLPHFGLAFDEVMKNIESYEGSYRQEAQSYLDANYEAHRELSELLTVGASAEAIQIVEDRIRRMDEIHDHFLSMRQELQHVVEVWRMRTSQG